MKDDSVSQVTSSDFFSFVLTKRVAAIHFDAVWDSAGKSAIHRQMKEAKALFGEKVEFGEVDCDSNPELAKSIPILNVPTAAYYIDGRLTGTVTGMKQNVVEYVEKLLSSKQIGMNDARSKD